MSMLATLRRNLKRLQNKDVSRNEQTPRVTVCPGPLGEKVEGWGSGQAAFTCSSAFLNMEEMVTQAERIC